MILRKAVNDQQGIVLVGVLAMMVLLMGVLMDFTYRTSVQLEVARNRLDSAEVRQAAESGVDIAKALLSRSIDMHEPGLEQFFYGGHHMRLDDVDLTVRFEPESAKINLNRLAGPRRRNTRREIGMLFRLADVLNEEYEEEILTYDMILSILEWISPQDAAEAIIGTFPGEPAGGGYYLQKTPPYVLKQAPLNTLSELLLVKDITEEVLYGRPASGDEPGVPGIADFLTLYGDGRSLLEALNREGLTADDLRTIEPMTMERYITIDVTATRDNAGRRIRTIVRKDGERVHELCREERESRYRTVRAWLPSAEE